MNKLDLIVEVAKNTGLTKIDATKATDALLGAVTAALKKGDEVRLVGFGTFSVASREATTGRNPRTGEVIEIEQATLPVFKAGRTLKDKVNAK